MVETNALPPLNECSAAAREREETKPSRSLVDYSANHFLNVKEVTLETKSSKTHLNTEKFRSYTEPEFIAEMWKAPRRTTTKINLKEIFKRKKYARFTDGENEDSALEELPQNESGRLNELVITPQKQTFSGETEAGYEGAEETERKPKVKVRTKIFTRRSQRHNREEDAENVARRLAPSSMHNDFSQIEASISFAAHVRRQGPGFSASCTQTLRTCDFTSIGDMFESEVQSNVTFNPLFEDDDSDDDRRVWPRRHRLYTIDEESEAHDSGS